MLNRIVLVGFAGAGKSTVAKKIAQHFNYLMLDTDKMLEEKYKISVFDVFEKYDENVFRKLEHNILVEALKQENVVIATGGGAPCFFNAMEFINENACSIYIEMSPKSLTHRLLNAKVTRPHTHNKTEEELLAFITEQLALRQPIYRQAHFTVKGEDFDFENVIQRLED